jgi:dipeptidyl aminopeptidase/acylaminoacyl peptidase
LIGCICYFQLANAYTQKVVIDSSVFGKWPKVNEAEINNNGNYIAYLDILASRGDGSVMIVQNTHKKWKFSLRGIRGHHMLQDGKRMIFQNTGDSLYILRLGTSTPTYIACVNAYKLIGHGREEKLCYTSLPNLQGIRKIVILSFAPDKQLFQDSVTDYWLSELGNVLVIKKKVEGGAETNFTWEWHNLNNGIRDVIWQGREILNYAMDDAGQQLAFISQKRDSGKYELWYYRDGMSTAKGCSLNNNSGIHCCFDLNTQFLTFNHDGKRIFFSLIKKEKTNKSSDQVQVDIWSYRDRFLKEKQLRESGNAETFLAWMDVTTGKIHQLESDNDRVYDSYNLKIRTNQVLMRKGLGDDVWWREEDSSAVYVHSLQPESQSIESNKERDKKSPLSSQYKISPDERYFLYFDPVTNDFHSYEIGSTKTRNITSRLREKSSILKEEILIFIGWLKGGNNLLIYDNWDIWQIDLEGADAPLNLTQAYGRHNHIRLRLAEEPADDGIVELPNNGLLYLSAFDTASKYSGFYLLRHRKSKPPTQLTMGPYNYPSIKKAPGAQVYLLTRESAKESPNIYITEDLVHFRSVTTVAPEKHYNWLSVELMTWSLSTGNLCQGMLFKPEDLNVRKKYPLLVNYYEAPSDEICHYREPAATLDEINIPYFVSRGYVVFVPDIHYRVGYAGESALDAIISGTKYVLKQAWIDSTRIGLQGHSFGGYETNYVITHCNLFAAAEEGSGSSDMISKYNGFGPGGTAGQQIYEKGQYRMGASLYDSPAIYINGSPILLADKVTTPLLMMHNKQDELVPWLQGVEFFSALRRCGKKVWMLQYDKGEHSLQPGPDALDYTIRIEQFFNHYLKGAPPPIWMTEGIPSREKGMKAGFQLDTSGRLP